MFGIGVTGIENTIFTFSHDSFSFHLNPWWTKRFSKQVEIQKYLDDVANKFGIADSIKFNQHVEKAEWEAIKEAGMQKIKFAWAGSLEPGAAHYYTVEGPSFIIEFVNSQPGQDGTPANHIHAMYRNAKGDFGLER